MRTAWTEGRRLALRSGRERHGPLDGFLPSVHVVRVRPHDGDFQSRDRASHADGTHGSSVLGAGIPSSSGRLMRPMRTAWTEGMKLRRRAAPRPPWCASCDSLSRRPRSDHSEAAVAPAGTAGRARIASATVAAMPMAISTSPTLNTFVNGSHAGRANTSVSGRRAGSATITAFEEAGNGPRTPASAAGSTGMAPPLARTAARLQPAPTAISADSRDREVPQQNEQHDSGGGDIDQGTCLADDRRDGVREEGELDHQAKHGQTRPTEPQTPERLEAAAQQIAGDDPDRDREQHEHATARGSPRAGRDDPPRDRRRSAWRDRRQ